MADALLEKRYWTVKVGWRPHDFGRHGYAESKAEIGYEHAQTAVQVLEVFQEWRSVPPQEEWTFIEIHLQECDAYRCQYCRDHCPNCTKTEKDNSK